MRERNFILPNQAAWQSIFSFLIASLITALLLLQLVRPWHGKAESDVVYTTLDLSFLPKLTPKVPGTDPKPDTDKTELPKKFERQTPQSQSQPQQASSAKPPPEQASSLPAPEPQQQDAGKDPFAEEKSTVASGLRIDKSDIARAYTDSRSDIQKLAGRAGQPLEAVKRGQIRQFGREVSQAKIDDCIKANPEGITIGQTTFIGYFAAAALAYNAVTGKCK